MHSTCHASTSEASSLHSGNNLAGQEAGAAATAPPARELAALPRTCDLPVLLTGGGSQILAPAHPTSGCTCRCNEEHAHCRSWPQEIVQITHIFLALPGCCNMGCRGPASGALALLHVHTLTPPILWLSRVTGCHGTTQSRCTQKPCRLVQPKAASAAGSLPSRHLPCTSHRSPHHTHTIAGMYAASLCCACSCQCLSLP